jgi:diguanylate cyclase (GGDEF)-like protein/putative nucleotidyltransferase with HDIG domain
MNLWSLIPLISCLTYAFLLVMALRQFRKPVNKVFGLYLFSSLLWTLFTFILSCDLNASTSHLIFWNNLVIAGIIFNIATYYHFVRVYTGHSIGKTTIFGYAAVLAVVGLSFSGFVVRDAYMVNGFIHHDIGPWVYILMAVLLPAIALIMVMLVKKYRSLKDPLERNKIAYLMVGLGIVAVYGPLNSNIPTLAGLPTDHLGTLANAFIIGYVIHKYKLLDIGFLARRALAYTLLGLVIIGFYVSALYLEVKFAPAFPLYLLLIINTGISIVLYSVVRPLRFLTEEKIDSIFHRSSYAHKQVLLTFSSKIVNELELAAVANEMLTTLSRSLRLTNAELLFRDDGHFITQFTYPKSKLDSQDVLKLSRDSTIAIWLAKEDKPLNLAELDDIPGLKEALAEEKAEVSDNRLSLLLPIKSQENMIGILALGNRQSGNIFYPEDIDFAASIAKQASIVIENAQLYAQAKERANIDELTGLYNHRHFHQRLDEEIARSSRFGDVFSLIIIDLDFFKSYNDIHGHLYGDNILKRVGSVIRNNCRTLDVSARYGGDEFAVILPETSIDLALKVAERLRSSMESDVNYKGMTVTCSIGVASWPTDGVMKEDLIHSADSALYFAKTLGRNRTCVPSNITSSDRSIKSTGEDNDSKIVLNTIYALAATVDTKDHYTYGHSKKVSKYASDLAAFLGYPEKRVSVIRTAGLLHDIGKIGVADEILSKKTSLNEEEWQPIHAHPTMGVSILKHVDSIKDCLPGVLYHHERFDGRGYPQGLKGDNIPLDARILAIADSFDAMTSARPYRNAPCTNEQAFAELIRCSGTQFDPVIVESFVKMMITNPVNPGVPAPSGVNPQKYSPHG